MDAIDLPLDARFGPPLSSRSIEVSEADLWNLLWKARPRRVATEETASLWQWRELGVSDDVWTNSLIYSSTPLSTMPQQAVAPVV